MRPSLLLAALVAVAACDAVPPTPQDPSDDPPAPATLALVRPLADTVVFGGSPRWVALEERFRHSDGAPLTYAAHSDGEALTAHVSAYDYLVLEPQALGEATVVVEARAEDGTRAADALAVEVLPACPPEPEPGARDYFPLEAGRTWRFEGTAMTVYASHTEETSFEASFTVAEAVCRAGERRAKLKATYPWFSSTYTRDFDLIERSDHTLYIKRPTLNVYEMPRYGSAAAPYTLEATEFFEPVAFYLCSRYSSSSGGSRQVMFTAGVGPVHVWRQRAVSHSTYGQGVQTCRLDLAP